MLPGADTEATAHRAEQLRSKVEAIVVRYLEKDLPRITVSIGVAVFPDAGDNPHAVLKAADDALYRAKEKGRNRVELFGTDVASSETPRAQSGTTHCALAPSIRMPAAEQKPASSLVDAS